MLEPEILLRNMNPDDYGMFMLFKSKFIAEGKNYPRFGRCDNADFAPIGVALGTDYEWQTNVLGGSSATQSYMPTLRHISRFERVVSCPPDFFILYLEFTTNVNGEQVRAVDMRTESAPNVMWAGRTFFSLLKNMREWSFLVDEPFLSDHPMAQYSKIALERLSPPRSVLDEIDAMPDMHLAKFLKGDENYRSIPVPFPDASENLKNWVISISEQFADKPLDDTIAD